MEIKGAEDNGRVTWNRSMYTSLGDGLRPLRAAETGAQDVRGWGQEGSYGLVVLSPATWIPGVTQARKSAVRQRAPPAGAEPVATLPPVFTDAGLYAGPQGAQGKETGHSTRTWTESGITRQKGRTNGNDRKFKKRIRGKRLTDVAEDTNNAIKGVDKKQKPGAVRERKRQRVWFQRVAPRNGCPREAPDRHQRRQCLPAGISMHTVAVTHMERQYRFDSEDRNGLTITWRLKILPGPKGKNQKTDDSHSPPSDFPRSPSCLHPSLISERYLRPCWVLLLVMPHRRKKTKMRESHPKLNETFEPGRPLGVFSYFYGCWKVLQEGRGLNAFRKLQNIYHESLPLEVRRVKSSLESVFSAVWRKTVKTLALGEEASGTKDKKMVHCWKKERRVLTHNTVRFGPRTLVGARRSRDEFLGAAHIRRDVKVFSHAYLTTFYLFG
ncbi:uncharacterized protein LOC109489926 isoform X2 [Ailuropoda melanoleuca]|uniref:uncharacterized protein LOC109489926 isoform X2 n=1 Tax=Ailuropoda melanoleuca TaxID=9646 RepID=UPI0014944C24|nr:uncharacterized protein LOC109489926 isoform X2 [Ailuropoda melanoleuca]